MENRNFINGEFINSISNSNIAIEDPSNKKTIASIDEALDEEIDLSFEAAKKAFDSRVLLEMDEKEKSKMMRNIAKELRNFSKEAAVLLSRENGKTIEQCEGEFIGAADMFDYYAGLTETVEIKMDGHASGELETKK